MEFLWVKPDLLISSEVLLIGNDLKSHRVSSFIRVYWFYWSNQIRHDCRVSFRTACVTGVLAAVFSRYHQYKWWPQPLFKTWQNENTDNFVVKLRDMLICYDALQIWWRDFLVPSSSPVRTISPPRDISPMTAQKTWHDFTNSNWSESRPGNDLHKGFPSTRFPSTALNKHKCKTLHHKISGI